MQYKTDVIVIGGGAAGLMSAIFAAEKGADVLLLERNEKAGKKIYITGKGRCNVTNLCEPADFLQNIVTNSKFCSSAIYSFSPADLIQKLENTGLKLVTERGNRVFPQSGKASDVTAALQKMLLDAGAEIVFNSRVTKIVKENGKFKVFTQNLSYISDKLVIATGGVSYPSTGSTGDGYTFAQAFGHTITPPRPSLCALKIKEAFVKDLQGLTLKNVRLRITDASGKTYSDETGEMLFTADGISGPLVLTASSRVNKVNMQWAKLSAVIDLKPALDESRLDSRILRDFAEQSNKAFKNSLDKLLPQSLIPVVVAKSGISAEQKVHQITAAQRKNLVYLLKNFTLNVKSLDDIARAVVTSGGVDVREVNPKNMESKLVEGLFFAGEVLDIDALTGGFNLQLAFSTGRLAGLGAICDR